MKISQILPRLVERQRLLAFQAARTGISTDPSIKLELRDLNGLIASLREARSFLKAGWEVEPDDFKKIRDLGDRLNLPIDTLEL